MTNEEILEQFAIIEAAFAEKAAMMYPVASSVKKACETCAFWEGDESAYSADCTLGELTRPAHWQSCPKWAARKPEPAPPSLCSAWGAYWGIKG